MRSGSARLPETAELPDLSPGVQLLETDVRGALPALVVDQVLRRGGEPAGGPDAAPERRAGGRALWADANGHARTRAVADVAPDRRVLRRVEVARGFTAYQHYALVDAIAERALRAADEERREAPAIDDAAAARAADAATTDAAREAANRAREHGDGRSVAVLVAPAVDAPYREDGLRGDEGREMLVRALARLAGVARRLDVPVVVTRTADDEFAAPVANAARETIVCERTPMGPRFATDEFETLVYPAEDGLVQTTLAFWQRVLERRAPDWATDDAGAATIGDESHAATMEGDASATAAGETAGDALRPEAGTTGQPAAAEPAIVRGEPVATDGGERR